MKNTICGALGVVGGFIANAFGGWDAALATLLIFMGIDYVTGWIVAAVFHKSPKTETGTLASNIGLMGLAKKGTMLLFALIGTRLDLTIGTNYIRDAVVIAFIANETLSIIENAGLMGLPLPEVIVQGVDVLKKKSGGKLTWDAGGGSDEVKTE